MPRRLSAFGLTKEAYVLIWNRRVPLTRLSWPLGAIFVLLAVARAIGLIPEHPNPAQPPPADVILALVATVAVVVALAIPITTSAYRLFLDEADQRIGLGFAREEWMYLGAMLRLMGRVLLIAVPMLIVTGFGAAAVGAGLGVVTKLIGLPKWPIVVFTSVVMIAGWLMVTYVWTRYTLVLPAAATGRRLRLSESARMLEGNVARLWGGYLVSVVSVLILQMVIQLIDRAVASAGAPETATDLVAAIVLVPAELCGIFLPIAVVSSVCKDVTPQALAAPTG